MLKHMNRNAYHRTSGAFAINTYNSQVSNRPMYSIRIGPESMETVRVGNEEIIHCVANNLQLPTNKLNFFIKLYTLQNWDNELFRTATGDKNGIANEVKALELQLRRDQLLADTVSTPVVEFRDETVTVSRTNRPAETNTEQTVIINPALHPINLQLYTLASFFDDNHALILEHN